MEDGIELSPGQYFDAAVEAYLPTKALSAPFTLEGWFIWLGGSGSLLRDDAGDGEISLGHDLDGALAWSVGSAPVVTEITIASLGVEWHHIVLICGGERSSLSVDGAQVSAMGTSEPELEPPLVLMRGIEGFAADVSVFARSLSPEYVNQRWQAGRGRTI